MTINQTRKIASVLVKVGQSVNAGDTLFLLESQESDEVKTAPGRAGSAGAEL